MLASTRLPASSATTSRPLRVRTCAATPPAPPRPIRTTSAWPRVCVNRAAARRASTRGAGRGSRPGSSRRARHSRPRPDLRTSPPACAGGPARRSPRTPPRDPRGGRPGARRRGPRTAGRRRGSSARPAGRDPPGRRERARGSPSRARVRCTRRRSPCPLRGRARRSGSAARRIAQRVRRPASFKPYPSCVPAPCRSSSSSSCLPLEDPGEPARNSPTLAWLATRSAERSATTSAGQSCRSPENSL